MTYEKDTTGIPEYALQPAKAPSKTAASQLSKPSKPKITPAEAVYHKEKFTYPQSTERMVYQFEEDILVPDTRADMREILLIDGRCDLNPTQKKLTPKVDDLLNMTGIVVLQTLYNPEGNGTGANLAEPVSVTTKVPYKYQWAMKLPVSADAVFSCRVKSVEAMIINERKFRVKISLEFSAQLYVEQELQFFEGLRDEPLELKRAELPIICLGAVKRDEISIDESFRTKDSAVQPESILKQEFTIVENYRQVTTEKIVINGFVYVSLLYSAGIAGGEGKRKQKICQHNQRIEFTQFISLEKELRGKTWSAIRTGFHAENMNVSVGFDPEQPDQPEFHITGEVRTRIELFESRRRVMVTDAYHREKTFGCESSVSRISGISDAAASETSLREIVSLNEGAKASTAVFCTARVLNCECMCEKGRVVAAGEVLVNAVWQGDDLVFHAERRTLPFRGTTDMESVSEGQKAMVVPSVKNAWTSLINEKQLELNVSLLLSVEVYDERELILLSNPHFSDAPRGRDYPMTITAMQSGETLWDVAKRYRTTEENIRTANRLEREPAAGRRLLIVR